MKKRSRKRRVSLLLGVVGCILLYACVWSFFAHQEAASRARELVSVYVAQTPLGDRQAEAERQVSQDLYRMRKSYFPGAVQIADIPDSGQIVYVVYNETFPPDYLTVQQKNGNVEICLTEGEKQNVWVYQWNGRVYLEGQRMKACENGLVSLS